jgi:hypothetical protein
MALLDAAARAVREALAATQEALEAAEVKSDAEARCYEAVSYLENALVVLESTPPGEH